MSKTKQPANYPRWIVRTIIYSASTWVMSCVMFSGALYAHAPTVARLMDCTGHFLGIASAVLFVGIPFIGLVKEYG